MNWEEKVKTAQFFLYVKDWISYYSMFVPIAEHPVSFKYRELFYNPVDRELEEAQYEVWKQSDSIDKRDEKIKEWVKDNSRDYLVHERMIKR